MSTTVQQKINRNTERIFLLLISVVMGVLFYKMYIVLNADFNDVLNKNIPAQEKIQIYSFQEGKPISSVKFFDGKVNQRLQLK